MVLHFDVRHEEVRVGSHIIRIHVRDGAILVQVPVSNDVLPEPHPAEPDERVAVGDAEPTWEDAEWQ